MADTGRLEVRFLSELMIKLMQSSSTYTLRRSRDHTVWFICFYKDMTNHFNRFLFSIAPDAHSIQKRNGSFLDKTYESNDSIQKLKQTHQRMQTIWQFDFTQTWNLIWSSTRSLKYPMPNLFAIWKPIIMAFYKKTFSIRPSVHLTYWCHELKAIFQWKNAGHTIGFACYRIF